VSSAFWHGTSDVSSAFWHGTSDVTRFDHATSRDSPDPYDVPRRAAPDNASRAILKRRKGPDADQPHRIAYEKLVRASGRAHAPVGKAGEEAGTTPVPASSLDRRAELARR